MSATFPSELALKAFADGEVLPGAGFRFFVPTTKLPIEPPPIGPADAQGEFHIGGAHLAQMTKASASLGIMDHGPFLGELWVRVLNLSEISRCRRGFEMWRASDAFPDRYLDLLDAFEMALAPHAGQELRVVAAATGGSLRVGTSTQRA